MPAITLGYPQIEQQIRIIRRRRNWLTVQQAVYLCGGAMLLGIALLIILAVRSDRPMFTFAFWIILAAIMLSALAGARSIWQRWLRADETPRWIDRAARLDDRLATLVAHHGGPRPSRLMATLVSQLYALRYRWEPRALVPRRVPRSMYFFIAAAVAVIAATFLERPPAAPQRFPHANITGRHPGLPGDAGATRVTRTLGATTGDTSGMEAGEPGAGGGTIAGHPKRGSAPRPGAEETGAAAADARWRQAAGQSGSRTAERMGRDAGAKHDGPQAGLPDRVQDMIRQALQQPPLERDQSRAGQDTRSNPQKREGGGDKQQAQANGLASNELAPPHPHGAITPQRQLEGSAAGRGANRGGGSGQGTNGIYGAQSVGTAQDHTAKTFELKLTLLGQSSRATMEPQRSKRGGVGDVGVPLEHGAGDVPLNPEQRDDESLVRGEIPAEHEAMIKRMFSRPDDEGIEGSRDQGIESEDRRAGRRILESAN